MGGYAVQSNAADPLKNLRRRASRRQKGWFRPARFLPSFDGAAGSASNFGKIEATGTNSEGVELTEGGRVVNGSAADTAALISGGRLGVLIKGAAGAVSNFGTITNSASAHVAVALTAGGTVTNGSNASSAALIAGLGGGVYVSGGAGVVTNFGRISGSQGVVLRDGGMVTNGQPGLTVATITGTSSNAVNISGAVGTVINFGTLTTTGSFATVALIDGGSVTNGASAATGALITGSGTGIYANHAAATVTNFGRIAATSTVTGTGVALVAGGSVLNEGTITTAAPATVAAVVYLHGPGSVSNSRNGAVGGLISGLGTGVLIRGGAGTVTNSGTIQSSTSNGVYLNGGGTVTNNGGLIRGATNGIYERGVPITVTNSGTGTLQGTGASGNGIYLRGGGGIVNSGTITGVTYGLEIGQQNVTATNSGIIRGRVGVGRQSGRSGNLTLTNSGTIASTLGTAGMAVLLGNSVSKSVLIVEAGSTFIGAVNGGGNAEIEFVSGGAANMTNVFGFTTVGLGNGVSHSLTLTDANFVATDGPYITVLGGNSGNIVNAGSVTAGSVILVGGAGADHFSGGAHSDIFEFSTTTLTGADTVAGNGGFDNELLMTTAGTVAATGVTGVEIFQLANGGANSLTLANANFTGVTTHGGFIRVYGGNAGNTVNASGVTGTADDVVMYGGPGTDHLTGGAGNDTFVFTAAALTASDTVAGGAGTNELLMTTPGTIAAGGVAGVESFVLASGGANTLALTSGNFTGVGGHIITVVDGNSNNTVTASTLPSTDAMIVHAGSGADTLTGGAGNDIFYAAADTKMTGGAGINQFTFAEIGTNSITDFGTVGSTDELVFRNSGFNLAFDQGKGTGTPQHLDASVFVANATGSFTSATERFAYNTTTGLLSYSAAGSGGGSTVVTLTGHPHLSAGPTGNLFFTS